MKEYRFKVTQIGFSVLTGFGNTKEEALEELKNTYKALTPHVMERTTYELLDYRVLDGTETETVYSAEADTTFIMNYTYRNGDLVAEEVIGFYHGKPNDEDTKTYATKGTVAITI